MTWFVLVVDHADHTAMAVIHELTRASAYKLVMTRMARLTPTQAGWRSAFLHRRLPRTDSPSLQSFC